MAPTDPASSRIVERACLRAYEDPQSFATTLLFAFMCRYGTEGLEWTPQTIQEEIRDDYGVLLPAGNFNRLMAGITLLTSDRFYKSLPDFIALANVLSGGTLDPTTFDPVDALEATWAISEAVLIERLFLNPAKEADEEPFTEEIRAYLGATLDDEGIIHPPDVLRLAIRDGDPVARALDATSDDPEMAQAVMESDLSKTDEIVTLVKERFGLLLQQLSALLGRSQADAARLLGIVA